MAAVPAKPSISGLSMEGDPARFVFGEHLGLHCLGLALSRVDVDESLAIGVSWTT
jgi:hypothetical protein